MATAAGWTGSSVSIASGIPQSTIVQNNRHIKLLKTLIKPKHLIVRLSTAFN